MNQSKSRFWSLLIVTLSLPLAGCPGSNSEEPETEAPDDPVVESTYLIGGVVNGLQSDEITIGLSVDGVGEVEIAVGPGPFSFDGSYPDGASYRVNVFFQGYQPRTPPQRCEADPATASGVIDGADVTSVIIECVPAYTVGGTVSGLTEGVLALRLDTPDGAYSDIELIYADGEYAFFPLLKAGEGYDVIRGVGATTTTQRCDIQNGSGTVSGPVDDVFVQCFPSQPLRVQVSGLTGFGLQLRNTITDDFAIDPGQYPIFDTLPVNTNGELVFPMSLKSGESYSVTVDAEPSGPDQTCRVYAGEGGVFDTPPDPVEVVCGDATVGGTVAGMLGTGLGLALNATVDVNGVPTEFELENLTVDEDGEFEFEVTLSDETEFDVTIYRQPSDPDQECIVENGSGTIQGGQNVDNVRILCPEPLRKYRFDNGGTFSTDNPLRGGEQRGGAFYADYVFDGVTAIPLGTVSGLSNRELFERYLDFDESLGVLYSNRSGFQYWLAVESPPAFGATTPEEYDTLDHLVGLDTLWRFRKSSEGATFRLVISAAHLLAYADSPLPRARDGVGRMNAQNYLNIHAYRLSGGQQVDGPFFYKQAATMLTGRYDPANTTSTSIGWELDIVVDSDALEALWTAADFDFNEAAGADGVVNPDQVASANLNKQIVVELDLTTVPVGTEFVVISEALLLAANHTSPEGSTAAYLRDPGEFEDGEPEGGIFVAETAGLVMLDVGDLDPDDFETAAGPGPSACSPGETNLSILELSEIEYRFSENTLDVLPYVTVTRSGGLPGFVSARVSLSGGSATPDSDFENRDFLVRFGDSSYDARTIALPIIDDVDPEADETLTVTLHSPEGCAELGAQQAALVTIVDDDLARGRISFASDAYEFDESVGEASIVVERTGGSDGTATVTVQTGDESAIAGVDYAAVAEVVTFQDGDTAPRTVGIPILDDADPEADKTLIVYLTSTDPDRVGEPSSAVLTIHDDDA
ncbi:MAG: hypothetical protein OEW68_06610, partial [Gammaproteobacteria bacterium]|nr:hypothetical protein [Gammaproteobacteria bacterium]MDH4314496.1 hypothetical protein [Gammaproteobacteria bacterium]